MPKFSSLLFILYKIPYFCTNNFQAVLKYTDILVSNRKILRAVNLESKRIEKQFGVSFPPLLGLNFPHSKNSRPAIGIGTNFRNLNIRSTARSQFELMIESMALKFFKSKEIRSTLLNIGLINLDCHFILSSLLRDMRSFCFTTFASKDKIKVQRTLNLLVEIMGFQHLIIARVFSPSLACKP